MRLLHAIVFSTCLLLAAPNHVSARTQSPADQAVDEAFAAVKGWAEAINSNKTDDQKVDDIVSRYAPGERKPGSYTIPLFLGTKSPTLATTTEDIKNYFEHFVKEEKPWVVLCEEHEPIEVSPVVVLFAGFYNFTLKGVGVPARYSFLMVKRGTPARWLIAHHHSSARPGDVTTCTPLQ